MAQHSSGESITIQRIQPREHGRLTMTSEAVGADDVIGDAYTGYDDDLSPPLMWTGMPDADTYALIVEDPDAPAEAPVLHWVAWNIPGTLEGLPGNLRKMAVLEEFGGLVQGRNQHGHFGYMGPKPPVGDGPHHYHFQLFALDMRLDLPPTTPLDELVNVMKAHTIASCELTAVFERPDLPSPARTGAYGRDAEGRSFTAAEIAAGRGGLDADDVDRHAPHDEEGAVKPQSQHDEEGETRT